MESSIARELGLKHSPMAIIFSNEKPQGAVQFKENKWGCVVTMINVIVRGKTAVFDRKTYGCLGGGIGLGFGDCYQDFEGGIEYFLSTGRGEGYREGECYFKTPEIARAFIDRLPIVDIPFEYVIFKSLENVIPEKETPQLIVFLANPDQLSALVVLAGFGRKGGDNVIIPFAAGCHTICLIPYHESKKKRPRAVVGITDISARPHIDRDLLSFTVPFKMFQEMEADVPKSFLKKNAWKKVVNRIKSE
jgi:hypothetical protein